MLRERLIEAMKEAMRAKDQRTLSTMRMVLAKLKDQDIAARPSGNMEGIGEPEIITMMQGMVKQRRESMVLYEQGGRAELVAQEAAEIAVIERFLPQRMSPEEGRAAVASIVAETGASTIRDMGKVMAALKARYAGQLDMAEAGGWVKQALGG